MRRGYDAAGRVIWTSAHRPGHDDLPDGLAGFGPSATDPTLVSLSQQEWDVIGRPTRGRVAWFKDDPATGARTFLGAGGWLDSQVLYDDVNRIIELVGADGRTTRVQRDPLGREVLLALPDGVTTVATAYAQHGRLITRTTLPVPTASGSLSSALELTAFGAAARVWGAEDVLEPAFEVEHDALGRASVVRGRAGVTRTEYDAFGRAERVWRIDRAGVESGYLTFVRDRSGAVRSTRDATGAEWLAEYDALHRPYRHTAPNGAQTAVEYRPGTDAPASIAGPDGDVRSIEYDSFGAIRRLVGYRPTAPAGWSETRIDFVRDIVGTRVPSRRQHLDELLQRRGLRPRGLRLLRLRQHRRHDALGVGILGSQGEDPIEQDRVVDGHRLCEAAVGRLVSHLHRLQDARLLPPAGNGSHFFAPSTAPPASAARRASARSGVILDFGSLVDLEGG